MISELQLKNFRGFENHTITFRPLTILVGRNNVGKSTIVEALRLISLVVSRFQGDLDAIPARWEFPRSHRGPYPFRNLEINLENAFYRYGEPPAHISATFDTGEVIEIAITEREIVARRIRSSGSRERSHPRIKRVSILPQVAPVAREERLLTEDYVRGALSSALAPSHFRNQLHFLREHFAAFKEAAEETWPGLRVIGLEMNGEVPDPIRLSLLVEDDRFPAEVAWMGHGLQMWLQMIWFLSRAREHETVILDEPDVYMHADLQRRLVRFVRNRHQQVIITTHSVEMMSEVLPENILIVDRSREQSGFASSLQATQRVLRGLGSVKNLHLARLWSTRRFLIVEEKDLALLKQFQNKLVPNTSVPIDAIPATSIGGWGGWSRAIDANLFLKNASGEEVVVYCILNSDCRSQDNINARYQEANENGISLHVLSKRELENYLLVPAAMHRAICSQLRNREAWPSIEKVEAFLEDLAEQGKESVIECLAAAIYGEQKDATAETCNRSARETVATWWANPGTKFAKMPGKETFSRIANWAHVNYEVTISELLVANHLIAEELPKELRSVLLAIEAGKPFFESAEV